MNAYVTLLSSKHYLPGTLALIRSLKRVKSKYPLIVMVHQLTIDLSELITEGVIIQEVDMLPLSDAFFRNHTREQQHATAPFTKGEKPNFHNPIYNFNKFNLWTLTQFDKLIFLDSDIIVLKNIDHLFSYPEGVAAPNLYETLEDMHRMNSGVFVAEPSVATFEKICKGLDKPGAFWPRTDQTFLQEYWKNWHGLPYIYNTLQYLYFNLPKLWRWENIFVLHYQYEKPWQNNHPKKEQLQPLIDLWWDVYNGKETLTPVEEYKKHDTRATV